VTYGIQRLPTVRGMDATIEVQGLTKTYAGIHAVDDLSFT
jgi:hypothetical protein